MYSEKTTVLRAFAAMMLAVLAGSARADELAADWPQWRGPQRTGVAPAEPAWPESLGEDALVETWRVPLGPSYSGPIVVGERVFTTETRDQQVERVVALDRRTGEPLWEASWEGAVTVPVFAAANGSWIRATPASDGERLYVAGMRDVLVCLDAASGDELWRADFVERYGADVPAFGFVSSPLVDDGSVYVQAAESVVKLDKLTGESLWRSAIESGEMNSAFSSPVMAELAGRRQLVVQTRKALKGLDPDDGAELWSQPIEAFHDMNILTPTVVGPDRVFTSAHTGRSQLWRLAAAESGYQVAQAWAEKSQAYMSSPVVIDGHVYMHLKNQRFGCLELATGEEKWRTRPYGRYWSMAVQGDMILALDETGELLLVKATPDRFELLDSRRLDVSETWAHVAVCGGQAFVRSLNALFAFQWKPLEEARGGSED